MGRTTADGWWSPRSYRSIAIVVLGRRVADHCPAATRGSGNASGLIAEAERLYRELLAGSGLLHPHEVAGTGSAVDA